jgi:hydrogenase/urease accessory protein HupE
MEFVLIYLIGFAITVAILHAVIRSAVRAAMMDHHEAVERMSGIDPEALAAPAPLKWWQR